MRGYNSIEELLEAKEGEQYQFKEAKTRFDSNEAARCCCALANCGGGKLVFGITDKRPRQVVGSKAFDQPERTRKGLIDKLHVMVDFQLYDYEGKRVLVFDVASRPFGLPVQVDGVAWWYEGDSLVPMTEEMRRAIYAETGHDFSADICQKATIKDIDTEAVETFRRKWIDWIAVHPEKKSTLKRIQSLSVSQLLTDVEVIKDEGITYAALILFGTKAALGKYLSQAEVIFEYRPTNRPGPAAAREEFRMGFFLYFDKLWELINLRNDLLHYQNGPYVLPLPAYNERVVREAILNAVSHRNYQLSGSIFVKHYFNRLEIDSPGGFPHGITRDNIMFRQAPRDRLIAEVLARCGLVERAGQGMDFIYELCIREAKSLPDFLDSDEYIVRMRLEGSKLDEKLLAIFRKIGDAAGNLSTEELMIINSLYRGQKLVPELREFLPGLLESGMVVRKNNCYVLRKDLEELRSMSALTELLSGDDLVNAQNDPINLVISDNSVTATKDDVTVTVTVKDKSVTLNSTQAQVLSLIKKRNGITADEMADSISRSKRTVLRSISKLTEYGLIERVGSDKAGYWKVKEVD